MEAAALSVHGGPKICSGCQLGLYRCSFKRLNSQQKVPTASRRHRGATLSLIDSAPVASPAKTLEGTPGRFRLEHVKEKLESATSQMLSAVKEAAIETINTFVENTFNFADEPNIYFQGNFAPVEEIGARVPLKIIEGEIPHDFPAGAYIRNGPNPLFGGQNQTSPFGVLRKHWFEGDGMLHGTFFAGDGSLPTYENKYVNTYGYRIEKDRKKPIFLQGVDGSIPAVFLSLLLNQVRFGMEFKWTCNTSIFQISDKWYANAEVGLPLEINPADLSTIEDSVYNANGAWVRPFTAHPKKVPHTGEIVTIGFSPSKPFLQLGVISANGQHLLHKLDVGLKRCALTHEAIVTEKYNVITDFPFLVDFMGIFRGRGLLDFANDSYARVGVVPRYGNASSLKWFPTNMCYAFHCVNAFDDGDEVVMLGMRSRVSITPSKPGMDLKEWYARGITPCRAEDAADKWVDGALFTRLHEWRMNMKTGVLTERDLTGDNFSLEMPRINENYTGLKNRYAYANCLDLKASASQGMPVSGGLVKIDYGSVPREVSAVGQVDLVKMQLHETGPNRSPSEPVFVSRPGGVEEDDGWIVTYLHGESTGISEVIIIDAQDFESKPLLRLELPQRVPYGFHGAFVLSK